MRICKLLVAIYLVASLFGCKTARQLNEGIFVRNGVKYNVGAPGPGWQRHDVKHADMAWVSEASDGNILVNSRCENVSDTSLEGLTAHLLVGMTEQNIIWTKKLPWSHREALETFLDVKLDGVPQRMKLFVLKKDGCVYDVVLSAPPDDFEKNDQAYQKVLKEFNVGATTGEK